MYLLLLLLLWSWLLMLGLLLRVVVLVLVLLVSWLVLVLLVLLLVLLLLLILLLVRLLLALLLMWVMLRMLSLWRGLVIMLLLLLLAVLLLHHHLLRWKITFASTLAPAFSFPPLIVPFTFAITTPLIVSLVTCAVRWLLAILLRVPPPVAFASALSIPFCRPFCRSFAISSFPIPHLAPPRAVLRLIGALRLASCSSRCQMRLMRSTHVASPVFAMGLPPAAPPLPAFALVPAPAPSAPGTA
jgi:hypothetical protein